MSIYCIRPSKTTGQFMVTKDGRAITTGHKREACQKFVHFNSTIGQRRATAEELDYFNTLTDAEVDEVYPVGVEINL